MLWWRRDRGNRGRIIHRPCTPEFLRQRKSLALDWHMFSAKPGKRRPRHALLLRKRTHRRQHFWLGYSHGTLRRTCRRSSHPIVISYSIVFVLRRVTSGAFGFVRPRMTTWAPAKNRSEERRVGK